MTPKEHLELRERYFSGQCGPDDVKRLLEYEGDFRLLEIPWTPEMGKEHEIKEKILKGLHLDMFPRRFKNWRLFSAAAAILLCSTSGLFFFTKTHLSSPQVVNVPRKARTVILPGSNKAILTLSDGSHINLDDSKQGLLCKQGGVRIGKEAHGLVYAGSPTNSEVTLYNTISTPRGGEYQVVLSDGTKVWLNSASALKFPATFRGKQRIVELTGEAYFEVAPNKNMPFKISLNKMAIEVLGTHFNVSAYPDEAEVKTTLLEGSVKLSSAAAISILKPGQQGVFSKDKDFRIHQVDVQEAIAWKNGYFIFDNENIQSIMRKVSRWYDVDIAYSGNIDEGNFGGTVSRFKSVSGILKSLELTGTVHFKVSGRRITVMP
jgi:transmembrane sensor